MVRKLNIPAIDKEPSFFEKGPQIVTASIFSYQYHIEKLKTPPFLRFLCLHISLRPVCAWGKCVCLQNFLKPFLLFFFSIVMIRIYKLQRY